MGLKIGFVGFSLDIGKIEYIKNSETAHIVWCCLLEIDIFAFLQHTITCAPTYVVHSSCALVESRDPPIIITLKGVL